MKNKFYAMYNVVKDLGSIRAKGVWMEDIIDYIDKNYKQEQVDSVVHSPSCSLCFVEAIATFDKYGMYTFMGNAGLPTLCIGSKSVEDWLELRTKLQEAGLLRK